MSLKKIGTRSVVTIAGDATVLDAAKLMREHHVGDVVVVRQNSTKTEPLGIVTDRDIVMSTVAFGLAPESVTVKDVMAPTLVTAKTSDSFYHVLNLMKEHGIRRIPLVDAAGHLESIISSEDIIALLASELGDLTRITERQHKLEKERRRKFA